MRRGRSGWFASSTCQRTSILFASLESWGLWFEGPRVRQSALMRGVRLRGEGLGQLVSTPPTRSCVSLSPRFTCPTTHRQPQPLRMRKRLLDVELGRFVYVDRVVRTRLRARKGLFTVAEAMSTRSVEANRRTELVPVYAANTWLLFASWKTTFTEI